MTVQQIDLTIGTGQTLDLTIGSLAPLDLEVSTPSPPGAPGAPGPPGPPGPSTVVSVEALVDLQALTAVKVMASNVARPARSSNASDAEAVAGIVTAAAVAGERTPIRTSGAVEVPSGHGLPVGPIYLGTDGSLTSNPNTGMFQLRLGYAFTATLLVVRIDPAIFT